MNRWIHKLAEKIYHVLSGKHLLHINETRGLISGLQGGNFRQIESMVSDYYIRLIKEIMVTIMIGFVLAGSVMIRQMTASEEQLHIVRQGYDGDSDLVSVYYKDTEQRMKEIEVEVAPVRYRDDELEGVFDQGFAYLEEFMLGENESIEHISKDLQLKTVIPGSGLIVNWISGDYEYLSDDGHVHNEDIDSNVLVSLSLELSYQEEVRKREYMIGIEPDAGKETSVDQARARAIMEQQLEEHRYDREIDLPVDQDGFHFTMTDSGYRWYVLLAIGTVGVIVFLISHHKNRLKEQMATRKKQLQQEYSYFMNQILLYLSAGATPQGAILRIISQYERQDRIHHPLYQELILVKNEIHTGVAKEQAFIHFGRRTGVLSYIKAMALLTQQMRMGGQGMAERLEQEEHEAFEHRKECAKRAGEEAGTKLLLPMILLMITAMVIVMYPALASFSFELM